MQTLDVIFYGDSITESWRGLQVGVPVEKFKGIPEIFAKAYGGIRAAAYSVSGKLPETSQDATSRLYKALYEERSADPRQERSQMAYHTGSHT